MAQIEQYKMVNISDIKPYENNSKIHTQKQVDKLADSIKEFGFLSPCIIDKDYNLIAGHGRIEAARQLYYEQVPCIFVEGLTEDQRKAYVIADNKLTEMGGWNKELVAAELSLLDLNGFNIDLTGFSVKDIDDFDFKQIKPYGSERDRTMSTYNLDLVDCVDQTEDFWQMPVIENDNFIPSDMIGFNYAKTSDNKKSCIHFYLDDYQFERVWNDPDKYIDILAKYDCILSPDFSLYMNMPMPMKIWNIYRSRHIGAYYQSKGIKVIPTISWAEPETYQFCFAGIPKNSIVSISTIGVKEKEEAFNVWKDGVEEMIKQIEPEAILIYGGKLDFDFKDIKVIYFENHVLKDWRND